MGADLQHPWHFRGQKGLGLSLPDHRLSRGIQISHFSARATYCAPTFMVVQLLFKG
jgi:hypothetical protein